MARPTKITDEKKLKLADFIRSGLTVKDAWRIIQPDYPLIQDPEHRQTYSEASDDPLDQLKIYLGLPVRFTYPETRPTDYYYNGNTHRVERFTRDGILQTMSVMTWRHKYLHCNDGLFLGTVI